ncbi:unnamed protein product [Sphagnum jensenii]|uniref:Uncharacterized protein n=1 Tax=Sphagnum jensenii TaxID=128206 RepID=A0ABP1BVV8_9BRYO
MMSNMVKNWFERTGNFIIPCNDADEEEDQEEETTIQGLHIWNQDLRAKGREELELPLPLTTTTTNIPWGHAFSLKEASRYQLKFIFTVRNNIVSGLTCINTVWKAGIMVQEMRSMLGTFALQQEPSVHILAEQLTPS